MKDYQTILLKQKHSILSISLNRPEVHNAFNSTMIKELTEVFHGAKDDKGIRVVVLKGEGKSFCAGADLNWMREIVNYSYEQNLEETLEIANLLWDIYALPKPTLAQVNGAAIGGGTGLLSACDIAIAAETAQFGLSEVKIGLVPAAISPYVLRKIGENHAREYFLTGRRIFGPKAMEIGLVNDTCPLDELDDKVNELAHRLLSSGPEAVASCKRLLFEVPRMTVEEAKVFTAEMIAKLRISEEGQEGMAAFLEKREPKWVKKSETSETGETNETGKKEEK